jgi:hypothetical protein
VWLGYAGGGGMAVYRHGRIEDAGKPGNASEITRIVIGPDGEPWIGAGDGDHAVYRHTPTGWQAVAPAMLDASEGEPQFTSAQGELWFNTWNSGLFRGRPGPGPFRAQPWPVGRSSGSALVQTADSSLYLIDRSGLRAISATRPGPAQRVIVPATALPPANFYRAVADPFGRIWATTYLSGVVAIWPQSGAVERITESDGLTSDRASPILADRDGNVWIGTERGLDRFSPHPCAAWRRSAPRHRPAWSPPRWARGPISAMAARCSPSIPARHHAVWACSTISSWACAPGPTAMSGRWSTTAPWRSPGRIAGRSRRCPGRWWKCSIAPSPPMARCGSAAVASA